MKGKFRRLPIEVTVKLVEHNIVLPTKRGVLSLGKREALAFELGEKNAYRLDVFLRGYEPVDQDARKIMEYLKNGS